VRLPEQGRLTGLDELIQLAPSGAEMSTFVVIERKEGSAGIATGEVKIVKIERESGGE
jgi:hypothetical protein